MPKHENNTLTPRGLLGLLNSGKILYMDRDLLVMWDQASYARHPESGRWERIVPLAPWLPGGKATPSEDSRGDEA